MPPARSLLSSVVGQARLSAMFQFGHADRLPSDDELRLFAQKWPALRQVLTEAEAINCLREAVALAQTSRQKAAQLEKERLDPRNMLKAALEDFQASTQLQGVDHVTCRLALVAAIQAARTAFRFEYALRRKQRIGAMVAQFKISDPFKGLRESVLRRLALDCAPVLVLDKAAGLDRESNEIKWGGALDPMPGDAQLLALANEIEPRFTALEHCLQPSHYVQSETIPPSAS